MNRLTDHNISSSSSSSSSFSKSTSYHNPHNTEEVEKTETKKKGGVFSNWFQSSESAPTSTSSSPSPSPSSTSSSKPATTSSSSPQQLFNSTGLTKESLERLALLSPSDRFHYAALCAVCLPYNVSPGTSRSTSPSASRNSMEMEMEMGKTNETNSKKEKNNHKTDDDTNSATTIPKIALTFSELSDNQFSRIFIKGLVKRLELSAGATNTMLALMAEPNKELDAKPYAQGLSNPKEPHVSWAVTQDLLEYSVAEGVYDARARVLLRKVSKLLSLDWFKVIELEDIFAIRLQDTFTETEDQKDERLRKEKKAKLKKWLLVGAATIGGGAIIGLTGGLAAPMIAAGAGAIIGTSGGAFLASAGGIALVTTLFGAAGAGLTGHKMHKRVGGLKDFSFKPITPSGRMNVVICMTGWLKEETDTFSRPWRTLDDSGEQYVVEWEFKVLLALGQAISNLVKDQLISYAAQEIIKQTVLAGILAAVAWPAAIISAAGVIDNPWSIAVNRSEDAGIELATVLQKRVQGCRPVTLVGFSLGAKAIFKCLEELADSKVPAYGIVEEVYLFGAPVSGEDIYWKKIRKVVSGRIVNGYCKTDWLLKFLYRTSAAQLDIAGLEAVNVAGVEDVDLSSIVTGHVDYPDKMPQILSLVGLSSLPLEILKKESEDDSVQLLDLHSLVETQHNATANSTTTTTTTTSTTPTTSTTSSEADNSTKKELGESNKVEKVAEKEIIENEEREKTNTINIDNRVVEQPSISKNVDNE